MTVVTPPESSLKVSDQTFSTFYTNVCNCPSLWSHVLALGMKILDEALQEIHTFLHVDLIHLQQVLKQRTSPLLKSHDSLQGSCDEDSVVALTSHICS